MLSPPTIQFGNFHPNITEEIYDDEKRYIAWYNSPPSIVCMLTMHTWAIDSGSSGLWSLKTGYWPDEVDLLIGGLSLFFRDSCLLILVRLLWPGFRLLSGLSVMRLWFWRTVREVVWLAILEESNSIEELVGPCGVWTGQCPSLVLPGRLPESGSSDFLCCLQGKRKFQKTK